MEVRRIGVAKITQAGEMLFWGPTGLGHIAQWVFLTFLGKPPFLL